MGEDDQLRKLLEKRDYYRARDLNHPKLKTIERELAALGWHSPDWPRRDSRPPWPPPPKE